MIAATVNRITRPPPTNTITTMPNEPNRNNFGPLVFVNASFCEPGIYSPKPSREMAKNLDLETHGCRCCATRFQSNSGGSGLRQALDCTASVHARCPWYARRIEIMRSTERELVFMVKPEADRPTLSCW